MLKRWSLIVTPNTSERGFNISFDARTLKAGFVISLVAVVAVAVFSTIKFYQWENAHAGLVNKLEQEIAARDSQLETIETEFQDVLTVEDKLRTIAGLKPRHMNVVEPGQGGQGGPEKSEEDPYPFNKDFPIYSFKGEQNTSIDAFLEAIAATQDGFAEIVEAFEKERDRLSKIPSINPVYSPDAWISSSYGYRKDPLTGERRFHDGVDIVAPRGTGVIAPADGVVTFAGWRTGLGRTVEIRHGYGYTTIFGHNHKLSIKKGDRVERGDKIATVGSSGRSTGPHLHYEVRLHSKKKNPHKYVID
jgi:murein DD-endopeptidase MepM/ murein hydrolase activator NlpD